jgi:hypothetical protein
MENKMMYVYQFVLEDGSKINYKTQGIFFSPKEDDPEKKMVKSATIIESFMVDSEGKQVIEGQVVESEQTEE